MLSFEEFKKQAYKTYCSQLLAFTQEELDAYFNGDEAQQEMKNEYNHALIKSQEENDDCTLYLAISCGYCLSLMF